MEIACGIQGAVAENIRRRRLFSAAAIARDQEASYLGMIADLNNNELK